MKELNDKMGKTLKKKGFDFQPDANQRATPVDVDTALKLGYGFPMGPYEMLESIPPLTHCEKKMLELYKRFKK